MRHFLLDSKSIMKEFHIQANNRRSNFIIPHSHRPTGINDPRIISLDNPSPTRWDLPNNPLRSIPISELAFSPPLPKFHSRQNRPLLITPPQTRFKQLSRKSLHHPTPERAYFNPQSFIPGHQISTPGSHIL